MTDMNFGGSNNNDDSSSSRNNSDRALTGAGALAEKSTADDIGRRVKALSSRSSSQAAQKVERTKAVTGFVNLPIFEDKVR